MKQITETVQVKNPLTEPQKVSILDDISNANDRIKELELQIEDLKEQMKPLKEAIEREDDNIAQGLANYKAGYVMSNIDCTVVYGKGIAMYYSVENGEKVDERPITDEEQLRLSNDRIDVEKIIRQSTKDED